MHKSTLAAIAVVLVAIAAVGGYWFGVQRQAPARTVGPAAAGSPPDKGGSAGAIPPVSVEAATVAVESVPELITAVGSLRSDESITVRPEVAGRISAIMFNEGQRVAKGATLVRLDTAINAAEVQQARANLKLGQSKYDRAVDLAKSNFISSQAKDEAENNLRVAEAAVSLADARLAKMEIKAPFSGIIGLRVVSVGDYVKEGADVVNLESIDPLKVDFRVPEIYMKQVEVGQSLNLTLDALPGKTYEGKVSAINPLFDAAGRSIVIRALVRNTDTALRPGMFARVQLITRDEKPAIVVPEQAIVPLGDEQYVYRVVDGKATRVKVDVGRRRAGKVEVRSGLAEKDVVVTAGQIKLREGQPVKIANTDKSSPGVATPASVAPPDTPKAESATPPPPGRT